MQYLSFCFFMSGVSNSKEGGVIHPSAFQAHSLDSMFTTTTATVVPDVTPTDPCKQRVAFPEDCLQSLLSIIMALMRLEDHIDGLLRSVAWDITGIPPKKTRRKGSIRGGNLKIIIIIQILRRIIFLLF
jgi:hypothetical protein